MILSDILFDLYCLSNYKLDKHQFFTLFARDVETYTKDLKSEESKLLNKKLITLNNVISDHEHLVKVVDKDYEADINQDEYVVVG